MSCSKSKRPEIARWTQSVEGQGIARAAAVAIGRDDGDRAQGPDRGRQRNQALGAVAVIIGEKDLHEN
jgi:hypothetical protein